MPTVIQPESSDDVVAQARDAYETLGFVHLRGVLNCGEIARATALIDDLVRRLASPEVALQFRESEHTLRIRNVLVEEPGLAFLVDHHGTLPVLLELLGPYLTLIASEVFVRSMTEKPMVRFHTDGGPGMQQIAVDPAGRALCLKVQFFLTDVSTADSANFMAVVGSHRLRPAICDPNCWVEEANSYLDVDQMPPGGMQIIAQAGDAIVFPHSLWHGVAPNRSGRIRKSVILRYGHMWQRPFDHAEYPACLLNGLTELQRRLLGDLGQNARPKDYYKVEGRQAFFASIIGRRP